MDLSEKLRALKASKGAAYRLGKVNNKYIIIDIVSYAGSSGELKSRLYRACRKMRLLLISNYKSINSMTFD